jgi:ABC-type enterochelin transport system ATPase subunit
MTSSVQILETYSGTIAQDTAVALVLKRASEAIYNQIPGNNFADCLNPPLFHAVEIMDTLRKSVESGSQGDPVMFTSRTHVA